MWNYIKNSRRSKSFGYDIFKFLIIYFDNQFVAINKKIVKVPTNLLQKYYKLICQ